MFSNFKYLVVGALIFVAMFFALSYLSEFVFFEPYFVLYISEGREFIFGTIIAVSALSALVIPMNVFRIAVYRKRASKISGSLAGTILGISAGACSCGPVGFAIVSTFGTVGGVATSFLTVYEVPLRLLSIAVLGLVYYTTSRSIRQECDIR